MKPRAYYFIILVTILVIMATAYISFEHTHHDGAGHADATNQGKSKLAKQSDGKPVAQTRLEWLEQNGEVPEGAETTDYKLAERTTWWGKPLDPKKFWAGRVIWLDSTAEDAARRCGRYFPPIPWEEASLAHHVDDDGINWSTGEVEGPSIHYAKSSKGRSFWDRFWKNNPKPPEDLDRYQNEIAGRMLNGRRLYEKGKLKRVSSNLTELKTFEVKLLRQYEAFNLPPEMYSEDALVAAYVLKQNSEYAGLLARGITPDNQIVKNFLNRICVEQNLVTEPDNGKYAQAANTWKTAYLNRLRNEKCDEQYIKAYLKAWNLSESLVFSNSAEQKVVVKP